MKIFKLYARSHGLTNVKIINSMPLTIFGLITIGLLICLLFPLKYPLFKAQQNHVITLGSNGFNPPEITIKQDDTVIFKNNTNHAFWPASDLHPTHLIYPEFDPKKEIPSGKEWQFKFTKVGKWRLHDHLSPNFTGIINVIDKKTGVTGSIDCKLSSNKQQCWEEDIKSTLDHNGLDAAFDKMSFLFNTEPHFADNCHVFAHLLGQAAYEKFAHNKDFKLTPKTSYCGYGFYHGFIEALLRQGGDMHQAEVFCATAYKSGGEPSVSSCYHGIGHGVVDGSNKADWGNSQAIIQPALSICDRFKEERYKSLCGGGVFNSLAIAYNAEEYGLKIEGNDPYYDCPKQKKPYFIKVCYQQFNTLNMFFTKSDITKSIKYVENISSDEYASIAMRALGLMIAKNTLKTNNYNLTANACQNTQSRLVVPCVEGIVDGALEFGKPNSEYASALLFCNSTKLTSANKTLCFVRLASMLKSLHSASKTCEKLPKEYRKYCNI